MGATLATPVRWWRGLARGDRRSILTLVGVPAVLFVVPALAGHPAIVADNLIQNFPLRALAGRQIAGGHLPLLNPYSQSGAPLLGGLNAGALYPTTLFFAVLWPVAAWVVNVTIVYATAGLGLYALARSFSLSSRSSLLAALSYALAGAMMGQMVHLGVVQGFSLLPWALLCVVALARRVRAAEAAGASVWRAGAAPAVGFAAIWGLVGLSGEPRAIADLELLTIVAPLAVIALSTSYRPSTWRGRGAFAAALGVGVAWGAGLGAVQLLTGSSVIGFSQRSTVTYWFFGSGSLALRWTPMLFMQDLLGGNGLIGPRYFVGYNLPEVTGYVGLLAVVAAAAFVARLTRRGWVGECRDHVVFVVIGVVGLFATWGTFTPAGHLFRLIPLFGSTRLPSRNVILVDLAGAMMLAWWLDRIEAGALDEASLTGGRRWFTLWPALFVVGLSTALLVDGVPIVTFLGAKAADAHLVRSEWASLSWHLALGAAVVATLLQISTAAARRWLVGLIVADLLVFLVFNSTGLIAGHTLEPSRATAVAALGTDGRTAMVDVGGANGRAYQRLGEANMNVFTRLPSVQGYGSLISTIYDDATGTHPQTTLNPCSMRRGTFGPLRLSAIAVAAGQLLTSPGTNMAAPSWCLAVPRTTSTNRYFGATRTVTSVTLRGPGGNALASGDLTVELLSGTGAVVASARVAALDSVTVQFAHVAAGGLRVLSPTGATVSTALVTTASPRATYQLDSPFELALSGSHWRLASSTTGYQVFRATRVAPPDWVAGAGPAGRAAGPARVTSVRNASWGDSWVERGRAGRAGDARARDRLPAGLARDRDVARRPLARAHRGAPRARPVGRRARRDVERPLPLPRAAHRGRPRRLGRRARPLAGRGRVAAGRRPAPREGGRVSIGA